MSQRFEPFDFIVSPLAGDPKVAIGRYAVGILLHEYPAKRGSLSVVDQDALTKYGPRVYQTIDNLYTECLATGRTLTLHVTWRDGAPEIELKHSQGIIIDPSYS